MQTHIGESQASLGSPHCRFMWPIWWVWEEMAGGNPLLDNRTGARRVSRKSAALAATRARAEGRVIPTRPANHRVVKLRLLPGRA